MSIQRSLIFRVGDLQPEDASETGHPDRAEPLIRKISETIGPNIHFFFDGSTADKIFSLSQAHEATSDPIKWT
jgi:hypothetical protein